MITPFTRDLYTLLSWKVKEPSLWHNRWKNFFSLSLWPTSIMITTTLTFLLGCRLGFASLARAHSRLITLAYAMTISPRQCCVSVYRARSRWKSKNVRERRKWICYCRDSIISLSLFFLYMGRWYFLLVLLVNERDDHFEWNRWWM